MKVFFMSRGYPPYRGGTENYLWEIYERLKLINKNTLITIYHPEREKRDDIIQVRGNPKNKRLTFIKFWLSCLLESLKQDLDIIHTVTYPAGLCGILPKLIKRKPLVTTIHDIGVIENEIVEVSKFTKSWKGFLQQMVCNFSDAIIVPSEKVKNDIIKYHKIGKEKIFVTDYGIDKTEFNENLERGKIRKKLGINKDPMILFIGMFGPKKGLEYAIEALPPLIEKFPNIKLVIGGPALDENYLKKLRTKIEFLDIMDHVIFGGYIDQKELPFWFIDCDLYVDPTMYGMGYCFPCVEAAAVGKPIVATKLLEEIGVVKNNFNGIIVDYRNSTQIYSAVNELLSNKDKMQAFSKNSMELVKKFDWNPTVEQTNLVYQKLQVVN